jgi:hypothetical protein
MLDNLITVRGLDQESRLQVVRAIYAHNYPELTGMNNVRIKIQTNNTQTARQWLDAVRLHFVRQYGQFSWPLTLVEETRA